MSENKETSKQVKNKPSFFKKSFIKIITIFALLFVGVGAGTSVYDSMAGTHVQAGIIQFGKSLLHDQFNYTVKNIMGDKSVGHKVLGADKGGRWTFNSKGDLYGNKSGSSGFINNEGGLMDLPYSESGGSAELTNAKAFAAFMIWGKANGVLVGYQGTSDLISQSSRMIPRIIGGGILSVGIIASIVSQAFGLILYNSIDKFNVFKYFTSTGPGGDMQLHMGSEGKWLEPIINILNGTRHLGFIIAIFMLSVGLAMAVFGMRGSRGGMTSKALGRFFLSMFALFGSFMMLSGLLTMGANMLHDENVDSFGVNRNIGGLILDVKDYLAAPYYNLDTKEKAKPDDGGDDKDGDKDSGKKGKNGKKKKKKESSKKQSAPEKAADADDAEKKNAGFQLITDFSKVTNSPSIWPSEFSGIPHGIPEALGGKSGVNAQDDANTIGITKPLVYAMNAATGVLGSEDKDDKNNGTTAAGLGDNLNRIFNGGASHLIGSWMTPSSTGSAQVGGQFGKETGITATYVMFPYDDGTVRRQSGDKVAMATYYNDTVLPGRMMAPFFWLDVVISLVAVSFFAMRMYMFIVQAIFDMIKSLIQHLPAAFAFGAPSAVFLVFASIIIMFMQIIVARLMISFYQTLLDMPGAIFTTGGFFGSGSIVSADTTNNALGLIGSTPNYQALGVNVGTIGGTILAVIMKGVLAYYLYVALGRVNKDLGSYMGESATRIAMRLAGINQMDPRYQRELARGRQLGSNAFGQGVTGGLKGGAAAGRLAGKQGRGILPTLNAAAAGAMAGGKNAYDTAKTSEDVGIASGSMIDKKGRQTSAAAGAAGGVRGQQQLDKQDLAKDSSGSRNTPIGGKNFRAIASENSNINNALSQNTNAETGAQQALKDMAKKDPNARGDVGKLSSQQVKDINKGAEAKNSKGVDNGSMYQTVTRAKQAQRALDATDSQVAKIEAQRARIQDQYAKTGSEQDYNNLQQADKNLKSAQGQQATARQNADKAFSNAEAMGIKLRNPGDDSASIMMKANAAQSDIQQSMQKGTGTEAADLKTLNKVDKLQSKQQAQQGSAKNLSSSGNQNLGSVGKETVSMSADKTAKDASTYASATNAAGAVGSAAVTQQLKGGANSTINNASATSNGTKAQSQNLNTVANNAGANVSQNAQNTLNKANQATSQNHNETNSTLNKATNASAQNLNTLNQGGSNATVSHSNANSVNANNSSANAVHTNNANTVNKAGTTATANNSSLNTVNSANNVSNQGAKINSSLGGTTVNNAGATMNSSSGATNVANNTHATSSINANSTVNSSTNMSGTTGTPQGVVNNVNSGTTMNSSNRTNANNVNNQRVLRPSSNGTRQGVVNNNTNNAGSIVGGNNNVTNNSNVNNISNNTTTRQGVAGSGASRGSINNNVTNKNNSSSNILNKNSNTNNVMNKMANSSQAKNIINKNITEQMNNTNPGNTSGPGRRLRPRK